MPWSAVASIAGGLLGGNSASSAAAGQAQATREANDLQRYIYDNNVKLNQPAIDAGNLSRNKLMQLLGLGGTAGGTSSGSQSREKLRAQLQGQFTTKPDYSNYYEGGEIRQWWEDPARRNQAPGGIDEAGLNAAVEQAFNAQPQGGGIDSNSADYGSLMKPFTGADLQNEPGYQFGMNQGLQALDRKNAASGGYFSGQALKAAQGFAQDYAGTKYDQAFNRDTTSKNNSYNRLTGLITPGQVATSQVNSAGGNYANAVGGNLTSNADAQGAAGIAGAKGWGNALTNAANAYTQNNANNSLRTGLNRSYATMWGDDQEF
jgi:hypothetical protein